MSKIVLNVSCTLEQLKESMADMSQKELLELIQALCRELDAHSLDTLEQFVKKLEG